MSPYINAKVVRLPSTQVNVVWFSDVHLSAVPPGRRRDDYLEAILDKLRYVAAISKETQAVGLCGGDFFHNKNGRSAANSLSMLGKAITTLRQFTTNKIYGIVGNHDCFADDSTNIEGQPIDILIQAETYHDLTVQPVLLTNQDETIKVLVEGYPYADETRTLERLLASGPCPDGIDYRVGIVHAYSHPGPASAMFGSPTIGYDQLKQLDYDFLLWGHDHSRVETTTAGQVTHIRLGSLARAALATDEVDRPVSVALLSFRPEGCSYKEKEVPVEPLEVAFAVADKTVEKVGKSEEVSSFFSAMETAVDSIEGSEPREVILKLCDNDTKLRDKVLELCEM